MTDDDEEIPREPVEPSMAALFRDARTDLPSRATVERGAERLAAALGTSGGGSGHGSGSAQAPGPVAPSPAPWLIGGAISVVAVAVAVIGAMGPSRPPPAPELPTVAVDDRVAPAVLDPEPGDRNDHLDHDLADDDGLTHDDDLADDDLAAAADLDHDVATDDDLGSTRLPDEPRARRRDDGVVAEADLLDRMRAASPARRLGLAREHEARFPEGLLVEEREALAIEALAQLARHDEAVRRADRFHARWPRSPYARRVSDALTEEIEPAP